MNCIFSAALGIGGSTLIGTGCGFLLERVSERTEDRVTAFAAGVMLAAAMLGLYEPAIGMCAGAGLFLIPAGTAMGVLFLRAIGAVSGRIGGGTLKMHPELMFVLVLALHKFPEGMAGGVGMNALDAASSNTIVFGIALQNFPEGAVMIPPMIAAGISRRRAGCIAVATGLLNAAGVFAGALWGTLLRGVMPLALSFAGGAMLEVIVAQMIPQTARAHTSVIIGGFVLMACVNALF